jgi:hypothetical protein
MSPFTFIWEVSPKLARSRDIAHPLEVKSQIFFVAEGERFGLFASVETFVTSPGLCLSIPQHPSHPSSHVSQPPTVNP